MSALVRLRAAEYDPTVQREVRIAENFEIAEEIDLDDWLALSGREGLEIGEQMRREAWPDSEQGLRRLLRVEPTRSNLDKPVNALGEFGLPTEAIDIESWA